ncbi:MAG: S9 family peptidase, partial [Akkermansiaceae bacterium]|nr:S9 family peptidase [Akkermansiaceae bacterium]
MLAHPFRLSRPVFAILMTGLAGLSPAHRPETESHLLTIDRIYGQQEFKAKSFSVRWLDDDSAYTFLQKIEKGEWAGSREIRIGEPGGKSRVLIPAADLVPPDREHPLEIDDYILSRDRSLVLIYTNSKRVWRKKSRGDYWLLDRGSRELRRLGGDCSPSALMFAKLSPTGSHVAYVRDRNIYLESLLDHSIRPLTRSPKESVFNGRFDWVYEEELGLRDGFRWSPDGRSIAFWQFDESGVRKHILVDHLSGLYPEVKEFGYPKAGQRNAACRIGVVDISSGVTTWVNIPGDSRNHYLARMDWAGNSRELAVQQL